MIKVITNGHFEYRINGELKIFDSAREYLFEDNVANELVRNGLVSLLNKPEQKVEQTKEAPFEMVEEVEEKMNDEKHENKMLEVESKPKRDKSRKNK